jgi:quercetin dioxygenase-like cupin family protein
MGGLFRSFSRHFSRCWRPWDAEATKDAALWSGRIDGGDRRQLLQALSAIAGGSALAAMPRPVEAKDASELPPPKRALTGRDDAGKSVFKSFDVTSKVVEIDSNPGLTFYELYRTEGVPALTGLEPDPMATGTKGFPGPGGTIFRLISYPPKRPEGYKPPPGVTFESGVKELSDKLPGMGDHFERGAPGMHTSDTIDYGVVVRGEMTLELDDGKIVHLRQGDCIVQNGTRHRWRNPLPEPCLMAFISVGGKRG